MKFNLVLHWGGQIVPPFILLFFYTPHGPGLWFLIGIPFFCLVFSTITLARKFLKFGNNKNTIARPLLTILFSSILIVIAFHSYSLASTQAERIFIALNSQCKYEGMCPSKIEGWDELESGKRYRTTVGNYISYPLTYYNSSQTFDLYLYQSLDFGKRYEGGVKL